ncbi:unnamed protein product [Didymodactylos carnosus]|uniref:DNA helicase n=1 Tax=Didymodactylos carnosus TaxID=1234261 RepID=A0A813XYV2_9BILA|nr:unnamed protein product [Didymodactylos carnosus]CAF3659217.1 unnamed protein product [Didymodactylos carnosus]
MILTDHINGDNHLKKDNKQDQLLMCVPGPGDTGKSQLIHAITEYLSITKRSHKLRKLAPTSNAAAQIGQRSKKNGDINELRTELNVLATASEAFEKNVKPLVCIAQDELKINIDSPDFHKHLLELPDNTSKCLPEYLPLFPGMHVLLT